MTMANSLEEWYQVINTCGPRIPLAARRRATAAALNVASSFEQVAGCKPKFHNWIHMTARLKWTGNPKHSATFLDESFNQFVASFAAKARKCFTINLLRAYRLLRVAEGLPY